MTRLLVLKSFPLSSNKAISPPKLQWKILVFLNKKSADVYNCEKDNWQAEHQTPPESCWEKPQTLSRTAGACVHKRHPSVPSQKETHPTK